MSFNKHERLKILANKDQQLMVRLQQAYDAIAGYIFYHLLCLLTHLSYDEVNEMDSNGYTLVYSELK